VADPTDSFGPMPGAAPQAAPAGPDSLVGANDTSKQNADQEKQNQDFTKRIRDFHQQFDDLARQYPELSKAARQCKDILTSEMVKYLSQQSRSPQGNSPQMLAA